MDNLNIISLNVRGIRGSKRFSIYKWLTENKFDVCLIQETYCTKDFAPIMKKGWNGNIFHSFTSSEHSKGVSILLRKGMECKVLSVHCDKIGRLLLVNIEVNGLKCTFCNVYSPNNVTDRVHFLTEVKEFVQKHSLSRQNLYLGGDYNCVYSVMIRQVELWTKAQVHLLD